MSNKVKHAKNNIKPIEKKEMTLKQDHVDLHQDNNEDNNGDQYTLIVENTDSVDAPKPGKGLFDSRKNRIEASLGSNKDLVSIVVQSFNRLDKTINCVESILKYSSDINYELILIDNGSTDKTLDYFKSVKHPQKTIVHVTKNIGSYVPSIYKLKGKYVAYVCNDTYVTKNWLTNLITCLKSDESIGIVVPVISNGSNNQGADITFNSLEEMQVKAALHNVSNPCLWHERIRLVIQLAVYKREILDIVGLADYGFFHDFADDDISFRIRRAGYKIVLCKDTFVHHDHIRQNMNNDEIVAFNNSIESGKKDFHDKYFGLDAWDDVNNYEPALIALIDPKEHNPKESVDVLGVDVACGTPILEVKNRLKENSIFTTNLSAYTTEPKYWIDLKSICSKNVFVDKIININSYFTDEKFDYIVLGHPINCYENSFNLLGYLSKRLKDNGHLLINLRNSFDFTVLIKSLGGNVTINQQFEDQKRYFQISIDEFLTKIDEFGYRYKRIIPENWPVDQQLLPIISNAISSIKLNTNPQEIFNRSIIRNFSIDILKKI
jgi:O-antigen biosynthesis protein